MSFVLRAATESRKQGSSPDSEKPAVSVWFVSDWVEIVPLRRAAAQAGVQPAVGHDPRRRDMHEGDRTPMVCCSVRSTSTQSRLTVTVFRPNRMCKAVRSGAERQAREVGKG